MAQAEWLEISRGDAPLVLSLPHTGTEIPAEYRSALRSAWLALKDTDWWLEKLYEFAHEELGATVVRTRISRSVIDVNRDPSGASLYPGQATTELCPTSTFDGEELYESKFAPNEAEIAHRKALYFQPYHSVLHDEVNRLRSKHANVLLYDAHSIRSRIPRLFAGELPNLNLGTDDGRSCDMALQSKLQDVASASGLSHVVNRRFKGGWITRSFGNSAAGIHAVQMEVACRSYMEEPVVVSEDQWPTPYEPARAKSLQATLYALLESCISFAKRKELLAQSKENACHQ